MAGGFAGGVYLVGHYISERLEEVKERVMQERLARDKWVQIFLFSRRMKWFNWVTAYSLRRRFQQNKEDVSYTILALIPTLSEQILEEMDVEGLTLELQTKSRASKSAKTPLSSSEIPRPRPPPSESSLTSSVDVVQEQDARSDAESVAHSVSSTSYSGQDDASLSIPNFGESSQSWVEAEPPTSQALVSSDSLALVHMSDSITTGSSVLSGEANGNSEAGSALVRILHSFRLIA